LKQRAILKAALDPREWRALNDLADVLEAAGRVKPIGSDTAWNQEVMKMARSNARPWYAGVIRNLNPLKLVENTADWIAEARLGAKSAEMADIITQPGAMKELKELRRMSPASVRFRVTLGHVLNLAGRTAAEEVLTSPLEAPPEAP